MIFSRLNFLLLFSILLLSFSFVEAKDSIELASNINVTIGSDSSNDSEEEVVIETTNDDEDDDEDDDDDNDDDDNDEDDEIIETFEVEKSQYFPELVTEGQVQSIEEIDNLSADSEDTDKIKDQFRDKPSNLNTISENDDVKSGDQYLWWVVFIGLMPPIVFVVSRFLLGFLR